MTTTDAIKAALESPAPDLQGAILKLCAALDLMAQDVEKLRDERVAGSAMAGEVAGRHDAMITAMRMEIAGVLEKLGAAEAEIAQCKGAMEHQDAVILEAAQRITELEAKARAEDGGGK